MFYFCCFTTTITTIITTTTTTVSLLLLIPLCKQVFISGAVELTTQLSKHVRILCVPKCRINKLGYLARDDYLDPLQLRVISYVWPHVHVVWSSSEHRRSSGRDGTCARGSRWQLCYVHRGTSSRN